MLNEGKTAIWGTLHCIQVDFWSLKCNVKWWKNCNLRNITLHSSISFSWHHVFWNVACNLSMPCQKVGAQIITHMCVNLCFVMNSVILFQHETKSCKYHFPSTSSMPATSKVEQTLKYRHQYEICTYLDERAPKNFPALSLYFSCVRHLVCYC
jgi:hypothetical protein